MTNEQIVEKIRSGCSTVKYLEMLYQKNLPLIKKFIKPYTAYEQEEDLLQEAYFGLLEAVNRYETSENVKFMTYARFWIRQVVRQYVENDEAVKGIWCVPKYSNPSGVTYSEETVRAFAALKPAAKDFRIFWDNAYGIHHLYEDKRDWLPEILLQCKMEGNPHMVYKFTSTSKVSFPGSGLAAMAASTENLVATREQMKIQTIGHDKLNQLRHARFYKDIHGMVEHMRKHADILRPKFEAVLEVLDRELSGLEIGSWMHPRGGYFISFDSLEGCAKAIVAKAKEAGLIMTPAGATFPYGNDPKDSNIRIAPSYPTPEELAIATDIFVLSVKLVSIDKILAEKNA